MFRGKITPWEYFEHMYIDHVDRKRYLTTWCQRDLVGIICLSSQVYTHASFHAPIHVRRSSIFQLLGLSNRGYHDPGRGVTTPQWQMDGQRTSLDLIHHLITTALTHLVSCLSSCHPGFCQLQHASSIPRFFADVQLKTTACSTIPRRAEGYGCTNYNAINIRDTPGDVIRAALWSRLSTKEMRCCWWKACWAWASLSNCTPDITSSKSSPDLSLFETVDLKAQNYDLEWQASAHLVLIHFIYFILFIYYHYFSLHSKVMLHV